MATVQAKQSGPPRHKDRVSRYERLRLCCRRFIHNFVLGGDLKGRRIGFAATYVDDPNGLFSGAGIVVPDDEIDV